MVKKKKSGSRDRAGWVAKLRGVETFDTEEQLLLVRADVEQTAGALAQYFKAKTWHREALGQTVTVTEPSYLVLRLRGHAWSLIAPLTSGPRSSFKADDAKALAKALKAPAIYFGNSDCASATEYEFFDAAGKSGERFVCVEAPELTSRLRDVDPPEDGPAIYEFVRQFMREQEAFVPPLSILFDAGGSGAKRKVELTPDDELPAEAIERLDFVAVAATDGPAARPPKASKADTKPAKRMSKEDRRDREYRFHGLIKSRDLNEVKRLLEEGVDPNAREDFGKLAPSALLAAIQTCNRKSLELSAGIAKAMGRPFDLEQVRRDTLEVVRVLLDAGADPDAGSGWRTPLSLVAESGDVDVAMLLLAAGADPQARDRDGATAVDRAIEFKQSAVLKLLRAAKRGT